MLWILKTGWHELTKQDEDTEQYRHQRPSAEASREQQRVDTAGTHVASGITTAHANGQRAGAALDGVVAVGDNYWQIVDTHFTPVKSTSSGQDSGCVIFGRGGG